MARPRSAVPSSGLHDASGHTVVTIDARDVGAGAGDEDTMGLVVSAARLYFAGQRDEIDELFVLLDKEDAAMDAAADAPEREARSQENASRLGAAIEALLVEVPAVVAAAVPAAAPPKK